MHPGTDTEKMQICWSGRENVIKDDESEESVIHLGVDFELERTYEWDERYVRMRGAYGPHLLELIHTYSCNAP